MDDDTLTLNLTAGERRQLDAAAAIIRRQYRRLNLSADECYTLLLLDAADRLLSMRGILIAPGERRHVASA